MTSGDYDDEEEYPDLAERLEGYKRELLVLNLVSARTTLKCKYFSSYIFVKHS